MSTAVRVALSAEEIDAKAKMLIAACSWGSAGLGLVPLPFVDLFGVGGLQIVGVALQRLSWIWEVRKFLRTSNPLS